MLQIQNRFPRTAQQGLRRVGENHPWVSLLILLTASSIRLIPDIISKFEALCTGLHSIQSDCQSSQYLSNMASIFDKPNPLTAFGELQVAQAEPKIQLQFAYNINNAIVNTSSLGTGLISQSFGKAILSTGASTNSFASASSHHTIHYGAGQGVDVRFAGFYTSGTAGSQQCIGLGDDRDGYFFGYSGSYFGVMRRRDGISDWTLQHDWNVDTMDGFGPTNVVLDKTKGNVYRIQFQWLGFGAIKYFIEDPNTGEYQLVHHDRYTNAHTVPSILNPTLPLRMCVHNTTNNTDIQAEVTSMVAMVEGEPAIMNVRNTASGSGTISTLQNIVTLKTKQLLRKR